MRVLVIAVTLVLFSLPGPIIIAAEASDDAPKRTWFAVEIMTGPNWDPNLSAYEQAFFKEHSTHLQQLRADGHIVMGSRYSDVGLLVFHSDSIDAINELMVADPSMQAGTFTYEVHAMNVFYPGFVGTPRASQ